MPREGCVTPTLRRLGDVHAFPKKNGSRRAAAGYLAKGKCGADLQSSRTDGRRKKQICTHARSEVKPVAILVRSRKPCSRSVFRPPLVPSTPRIMRQGCSGVRGETPSAASKPHCEAAPAFSSSLRCSAFGITNNMMNKALAATVCHTSAAELYSRWEILCFASLLRETQLSSSESLAQERGR